MNAQEIYEKLDSLFAQNRIQEVEPFLLSCLEQARSEEDYGVYISGFTEAFRSMKKPFPWQKTYFC